MYFKDVFLKNDHSMQIKKGIPKMNWISFFTLELIDLVSLSTLNLIFEDEIIYQKEFDFAS